MPRSLRDASEITTFRCAGLVPAPWRPIIGRRGHTFSRRGILGVLLIELPRWVCSTFLQGLDRNHQHS